MATNNAVNVALSGSTGTGSFVGSNSPTLVTPNIGAATGTSLSTTGNLAASNANVGGEVLVISINTDNTNSASNAAVRATTGGASSGDPKNIWTVNGVVDFAMGIDNSVSGDPLKISRSDNLGSNDMIYWDSSGNTNIESGKSLYLQNATSSYTPSPLNYYEETSVSMSVSGAWSETVTLYITRLGRMVILTYPDISTGSASASTLTSSVGVVPARFRPVNTINWVVFGRNNAANATLFCTLTSAGTLGWTPSTAANFTAGAAAAAWGSNLTYIYNV